jgi:isoquinoline 1-oxidoreductase subunit beta
MHESFETVVAFVVEAGVKDGTMMIGDVTASVHCNFCVNPHTVETQIQGSALMALATTVVHIVPSNDPPKGVGEPGLPPFAPALANALRRATGEPLRELPFKLA